MKISKFILVSLIICAMIMESASAAIANVKVVPSSKKVIVGQTFDVNISVDPRGTPITGVQMNIKYNNTLLRLNNITEGNLFKQNGTDSFFNPGIINTSNGTAVNVFSAILGNNSVNSTSTFVILNFTAVGIGKPEIKVSNVRISDRSSHYVRSRITNTAVQVIEDTHITFMVITKQGKLYLSGRNNNNTTIFTEELSSAEGYDLASKLLLAIQNTKYKIYLDER